MFVSQSKLSSVKSLESQGYLQHYEDGFDAALASTVLIIQVCASVWSNKMVSREQILHGR